MPYKRAKLVQRAFSLRNKESQYVKQFGTRAMPITWFSMLLIFLSVLIVPQPAGAEYVTATIAVGSNPLDVAVNPVTNKTYVTNFDSQNVTVIDGKMNAAVTVAVGRSPGPVAVNPVKIGRA
ncbi:MAG: hypothetical protein HGA43_12545, partial [Nitrospirae bacterium]|nr:hypothetical protein [Nitrospirota bacterium]